MVWEAQGKVATLGCLETSVEVFSWTSSSPFDLGQEALTQTWDGQELSV